MTDQRFSTPKEAIYAIKVPGLNTVQLGFAKYFKETFFKRKLFVFYLVQQ